MIHSMSRIFGTEKSLKYSIMTKWCIIFLSYGTVRERVISFKITRRVRHIRMDNPCRDPSDRIARTFLVPVLNP